METSVTAPRRALPLVAIGVLAVIAVVVALFAIPALRTSSETSSASSEQDLAIARSYVETFNSGMKTGDFSSLSGLMAPDVVVTTSNPQGQTAVHRGLSDTLAYFQAFQKGLAGYQWTTDDMRSLGPGVVIAYEHAGSPPQTIAGRCFHVFHIVNGKIVSYDWTTFYPGVK